MESGHRPPFFLLSLLLLSLSSPSSAAFNPDYQPLQAFRSSSDPTGAALSSWGPTSDPCSRTWAGVACRDGRVTRLLLPGRNLQGSIHTLTLLPHLRLLNLSHNRLSGDVPAGIVHLRRLRRLDLSGNLLSGRIPPEIGLLPRLLTLRLGSNLLTGEIPSSLDSLRGLSDFNVADNRLIGEIPRSLSSFPASSFARNWNLCGKPLVQNCTNQTVRSDLLPITDQLKGKRKPIVIVVVILIAAIFVVVVVVLIVYCRSKSRREKTIAERDDDGKAGEAGGDREEENKVVFFDGCKGFVVDDLMRGSAEMLGRGAVGTTYRVVMEGEAGREVVVKRVRRGDKTAATTTKGKDERKAAAAAAVEGLLKQVGRLRHSNVVSLRAYYRSDDELLLVYDYLPNGSLHSLLHGNRGPGRTPLDWTTRLKLALGAAEGLAFLHGAFKSKLSHQHLTSSNILVGDNGDACISDFALHQLLSPSSSSYVSSTAPPELLDGSAETTGKVTEKGDVYCFGIVLLEILTGRTAGDGEMDLAKWVKTVVSEEWTSEVFDMELLRYKEMEDEMVAILQVALLCLAPAPSDRPKMRVVFKMIQDIRERGDKRGRGSHSPSSPNDFSYDSTPTVSEGTPTFTTS